MASDPFRFQRRVEFRDTDMAGIVHFSVFFTYMEEAEHALLRHLGMSVISEVDGQKISWPRVAANCNFVRAIKFEQVITIEVVVERIGTKSVTYGFRFLEAGDSVAHGTVTAVCCRFEHGLKPTSMTVPDAIRERLAPYLLS